MEPMLSETSEDVASNPAMQRMHRKNIDTYQKRPNDEYVSVNNYVTGNVI